MPRATAKLRFTFNRGGRSDIRQEEVTDFLLNRHLAGNAWVAESTAGEGVSQGCLSKSKAARKGAALFKPVAWVGSATTTRSRDWRESGITKRTEPASSHRRSSAERVVQQHTVTPIEGERSHHPAVGYTGVAPDH
jgi:hypothetical protein